MPGRDITYTVVGRWPFPLDMLRRDRSRAATPEDQEKINLLSREVEDLGDTAAERRLFRKTPVAIRLVIEDAGKNEGPLVGRWQSFGWDVPSDPAVQAAANEAAREKRMRALHAQAVAKLSSEEREAVEWFAPRAV